MLKEKNDFEMMLFWALGRTKFKYNIRQALVAWNVRHPELPALIVDSKYDISSNIKLIMFQITQHWFESKRVQDDKPSLFRMVRGMFRDLVGKGDVR